MSEPIEMVTVPLEVSLPKKQVDGMRANAEDKLEDLTDKQIVSHLAEDIIERYFHPEYFDLESLRS